MFTAAQFTIATRWGQSKCPSADEWISKMCYTHTAEYYVATKRNEELTRATTRVSIGNMMLSGRSQTQKAVHCMVPLMSIPRVGKPTETESS